MGLGNVGCFVAHSLASRKTRPPITLLLHHRRAYENWRKRKQKIHLKTNGMDDNKTGFDINVLDNKTWYSLPYWNESASAQAESDEQNAYSQQTENALVDDQDMLSTGRHTKDLEDVSHHKDDEKIECLIVTTKATNAARAVASVSHRLSPDSTILFLHNGMGVVEEVNEKVFPDPNTRPNYLQGIISHGLKHLRPFHIEYTGVGTTIVGALPSSTNRNLAENDWAPSMKYLLRTITLTPQLVAVAESPIEVLQCQLEKLAMNCIINPLTAIMDVKNGELLYTYHMDRTIRLLCAEISMVIRSLPELDSVPGIMSRFSAGRLRKLAIKLANATAANTSSMLQDLQDLKETEIEFINGYIVRRGDESGIRCVLNYMIMQMVIARCRVLKLRDAGVIPLQPWEAEEMDGEDDVF